MYVSLYGDATYQVTRTDGLAFDADPKSITYEVDGGIADGKTHEEIADQVAAISISAPAAEEAAAGGESKEEATADKPAEAASGAASTVAAGTIMGIITSTLML